jgi:predicted dehydrogenase
MDKKLKLGVIGGGLNSAIGQTHFIASRMDFSAEIVSGFFSKNETNNRSTGSKFGIGADRQYKSLENFISGEKDLIDLVLVLTPTVSHHKDLKELLSAGFNVVCEKSLVLNTDEAKDIQKILLKNKNFLSVIHNYTGYPMIREMREVVSSGDLGEVISFSINMPQQAYVRVDETGAVSSPQSWRLQDDSNIPHVSLDLGIHVMNLLNFIFNVKVKYVVAQQNSYGKFKGVIDYVQAMICLDNNAMGSISYGKAFLGQDNGLEIKVFGTKGSVSWKQKDSEYLGFCNEQGRKSLLTFSSPGLKEASAKRYHRFKPGHPTGFLEAFSNHYQDIFKAFLKKPVVDKFVFNLDDAIRDLHLLELITKSSLKKEFLFNTTLEDIRKNAS